MPNQGSSDYEVDIEQPQAVRVPAKRAVGAWSVCASRADELPNQGVRGIAVVALVPVRRDILQWQCQRASRMNVSLGL